MKNKTELKRKLQQVGNDNDGYVGYYLVALHNKDNTEALNWPEEIGCLLLEHECNFVQLCAVYDTIKWPKS